MSSAEYFSASLSLSLPRHHLSPPSINLSVKKPSAFCGSPRCYIYPSSQFNLNPNRRSGCVMEVSNVSKNRIRDEHGESQVDMQETKRVRLDSSDYEQIKAASGLLTVELEEGKAVQGDLKILVDSDPVDSSFHGLDWVIRSLEEEIHLPQPGNEATTQFCEPPPDLGYLLKASDDELGIPPTVELAEEDKNEVFDAQATSSSPTSGFEGSSGFPSEISSYDLFDIGVGGDFSRWLSDNDDIINLDFVALDGLFDYSDSASELAFWSKSLSSL